MRATLMVLAMAFGIDAAAQHTIAPPEFFEYLKDLQAAPPMAGPVIDGDSATFDGLPYKAEGDVKFLRLPKKFEGFWIAAVGEGEDHSITVDTSAFADGEFCPAASFQPYYGTGERRLESPAAVIKVVVENGQIVGRKFTKPSRQAGWFWVAARSVKKRATAPFGKMLPNSLIPPDSFLDAIFSVENPLKAPTLKEELIVIDGMKIKVEAPAKFMVLPEELKGFWVAPVSGGKSGAVLVDSERWKVGFLPFENGKSKGNAVEPLKGEPIVINGATVGWRFAKPAASAGWFISMGLLPQQPAESAPKEATAP